MKYLLLFFLFATSNTANTGKPIRDFLSAVREIINDVSSQNLKLTNIYENTYEEDSKLKIVENYKNIENGNLPGILENDKGNEDYPVGNSHGLCKTGRCGCGAPARCGCGYPGRCGNEKTDYLNELIDDVDAQIKQDTEYIGDEIITSYTPNNKLEILNFNTPELQFQSNKQKKTKDRSQYEDTSNDLKSLVKELYDVKAVESNENQQLKRSKIPYNPMEIATHYKEFKSELIQRISDYVKNKSPTEHLPYLPLKPRNEFKILKKMYLQKGMADSEIEREIVNLVLGDRGNMRIVPHNCNKCNAYEIVVPQWLYHAFYKKRTQHKQRNTA